jgi:hypothetical protein
LHHLVTGVPLQDEIEEVFKRSDLRGIPAICTLRGGQINLSSPLEVWGNLRQSLHKSALIASKVQCLHQEVIHMYRCNTVVLQTRGDDEEKSLYVTIDEYGSDVRIMFFQSVIKSKQA